jgi:hypothetical protein
MSLTKKQYNSMMEVICAHQDDAGYNSEGISEISIEDKDHYNVALTIRKTRKPNELTGDYEGIIEFVKEAYNPTKWEGHFEWEKGLHYHALFTTSTLSCSKEDINRRLVKAFGTFRGWNFKIDYLDFDDDYERWQSYIRKNAGCDKI